MQGTRASLAVRRPGRFAPPLESAPALVEVPPAGAAPAKPGTAPREILSPELVLVSPELRRLALAQLPEIDPDGFLPKRTPRPAIAPVPPTASSLAPAPGLELRHRPVEVEAPAPALVGIGAKPGDRPEQQEECDDGGRLGRLAVAAAAYGARQALVVAVQGVALAAALAGVLALADVIRL